jgi:hypothetical protein
MVDQFGISATIIMGATSSVRGRTAVATAPKVDSRLTILRKVVAEYAIKSFNPSPFWKVVADMFNVQLDADESFVSIVERNGGAWVVIADGDDSYSATIDMSTVPEGVALTDINEWQLAVVEATREYADNGKVVVSAGESRLRAYPVFEEE